MLYLMPEVALSLSYQLYSAARIKAEIICYNEFMWWFRYDAWASIVQMFLMIFLVVSAVMLKTVPVHPPTPDLYFHERAFFVRTVPNELFFLQLLLL